MLPPEGINFLEPQFSWIPSDSVLMFIPRIVIAVFRNCEDTNG